MRNSSAAKYESISLLLPSQKNRAKSVPIDTSLRRTTDVVCAFLGLLLCGPIFLFIAFLIKFDTPGPILYPSKRVGKNGVEFLMWKFRTMYENDESYPGPSITAHDDPRITPYGRWLRKSKLNELPQLWNVLKGEMTLVGPRPEVPQVVKYWPDELREEITSIRPGMTSPASMLYRNEEELLSTGRVYYDYLHKIMPQKLRSDLSYIHRRSLLTDLAVLSETFKFSILQLNNRSSCRERRDINKL